MINSVLKALDVLELFSSDRYTMTLGEIAERLGFPKSTTHNLLTTLVSRGYIERTEEGLYALGTAIMPLTQGVRVNVELRDRAAPLLRELANLCRESVYLATLDGDLVLYLYAVESPQRLLARTAVGDRVPPHCTAVGKAILSLLPEEKVLDLVNRVGLPKYTARTITDLGELLHELRTTRVRGYATDEEEHELGTHCIGVPIRGATGEVEGACSISGHDPISIRRYLDALVLTGEEISRRMGYVQTRSKAALAQVTVERDKG